MCGSDRGRGVKISEAKFAETTPLTQSACVQNWSFFKKCNDMAKGRKSTPDAVKILRGTDQPCRMSGSVDKVDRITDIKKILSTSRLKLLPTKRSKEIFKTKANQLIALGVLTELDIEHLAVYANSLDVLFSCMDGMREPAKPKYDKEGQLTGYVTRPEAKMYKQMIDDVNRIGAEFGFTPVSRQRINQKEHEEQDPFKNLLDNI